MKHSDVEIKVPYLKENINIFNTDKDQPLIQPPEIFKATITVTP